MRKIGFFVEIAIENKEDIMIKRSVVLSIVLVILWAVVVKDVDAGRRQIVLTEQVPDTTIFTGEAVTVYGTSGKNQVTINLGANVKLINFPGSNIIKFVSGSSLFYVYRYGAVVIFFEPGGTVLRIPATKQFQSIVFDDITLNLVIQNNQIILGSQVVTLLENKILANASDSIEMIIADMTQAHERRPNVNHYLDWYMKPIVHYSFPPEGFGAITVWAQFFEEEDGNPATNTRVQAKELELFYLSKRDGKWHQLQKENPILTGSWFTEESIAWLGESDQDPQSGGLVISATAGNGKLFHFWIVDRDEIEPNDIGGIFASGKARLIVDDPNLPDDRKDARYIFNVGVDYWREKEGGSDNFNDNLEWGKEINLDGDIAGVGMGRFKCVHEDWQNFYFTSLSEEDIRRNPPPLD